MTPLDLKVYARWRRDQEKLRRWNELGLTPEEWRSGADAFGRILAALEEREQAESDCPHFLRFRRPAISPDSRSSQKARELLAAIYGDS